MTMNLIQNLNNTLDNNLLSYGLLGGSLAILGFSTLYFVNKYLFKSNEIYMEAWNNDNDNIIQQIGSKLENPNISGLDINKVPNLDTLSESLLYKVNESVQATPDIVEANVQTISNTVEASVQTLSNTVEANVQTSSEALESLLNEILQEILYNDGTPVTSLGEMQPEVFKDLIKNDPNGPKYLERIQEWSNNVEGISRVSSSNDSQVVFLRNYTEQIKDLVENLQLISLNIQQENMKDLQSSKFD
jgi:hypothetical protein